MGNYFSQDDLIREYEAIFPDTCVILEYLRYNKNNLTLEEKIEKTRESIKSCSLWNKLFEAYGGKNLFLFEGLIDELYFREKSFFYKANLNKKVGGRIYKMSNYKIKHLKLINGYRDIIQIKNRRVKNLVKTAKKTNAMVNLTNTDGFDELYKKCLYLKNQKNALSDIDYGLLISAMIFSKKFKTAIISNDYGIRGAWFCALLDMPHLKTALNFYNREDKDKYFKFSFDDLLLDN